MTASIGITATVPLEIIFAAGLRPVDLNNLFITSGHANKLVAQGESVGFSHNICAWIKGIYATVMNHGIKEVIAVTGGDCSNTIALGELLVRRGVKVLSFEYPLDRERHALIAQLEKLRKSLSTSWPAIESAKSRLDKIRGKLKRLDEMTYGKNVITGAENHMFLVSSSDFGGDPDCFEKDLDQLLVSAENRKASRGEIRLGYLGVPPIFSGLYEFIESLGARVVFNEVQRQFSMPYNHTDIVDQYLQYTYPYDINARIWDIEHAIKERRLEGLIHYTQNFCYRQIYDIVFRESLPLPILTLEGDRPVSIDGRTAFRIEAFVEMLRDRKKDRGL
ncbi:MAG: 2-hydroxyacyl-CoA dehydratase [Thermodesulfobacteriota bacterium]|nr:2-hydroxyacyl-CoA dehydratase [Thermodesulfobacteriota bacterium]